MTTPQTFLRIASLLCGLWLLIVLPFLNWGFWKKLPVSMRSGHGDFEQYYSGALVVRHGLWDQLYPVAKPYYHQLRMWSYFKVPLFSKAAARRDFLALQIASPRASDASPTLLSYCHTFGEHCHYIYPPPLALYFSPLGFLKYDTARKIWFELMCAALFGSTWVGSRITREIWGKVSYAEGSLFLLVFAWTLLGNGDSTQLAGGNVSPLLGFLIALIAYSWIKGREKVVGLALVLLIPFKGIGLNWCPLLLLRPMKRKALAIMACVTVFLNGIAVFAGGLGPYRCFFYDILPFANMPVGTGLQRRSLLLFGDSFQKGYLVLGLALLGVLYWGYWRKRISSRHSLYAIAMFAGTMALFCEFNPVVWIHYLPHYLLIPFFGWLVWEVCHCSKRLIRNLMWVMLFANLLLVVQDAVLLIEKSDFLVRRFSLAGVTSDLIVIEPIFVLLLVFNRLFAKSRIEVLPEAVSSVALH
jgi:hypothetical protein